MNLKKNKNPWTQPLKGLGVGLGRSGLCATWFTRCTSQEPSSQLFPTPGSKNKESGRRRTNERKTGDGKGKEMGWRRGLEAEMAVKAKAWGLWEGKLMGEREID